MNANDRNERLNRLQSSLSKIGYRLRHCGCNHYRVINYLGEATMIEFYGDTMHTSGHPIFGHKASECGDAGRIYFEIDRCEIEVDESLNCLTISSGGAYLTFHNFSHNKSAEATG